MEDNRILAKGREMQDFPQTGFFFIFNTGYVFICNFFIISVAQVLVRAWQELLLHL